MESKSPSDGSNQFQQTRRPLNATLFVSVSVLIKCLFKIFEHKKAKQSNHLRYGKFAIQNIQVSKVKNSAK